MKNSIKNEIRRIHDMSDFNEDFELVGYQTCEKNLENIIRLIHYKKSDDGNEILK